MPPPLRVGSDFEAELFVVDESVFAFQFLPDRDFETATFASLNRVLVAPNVGAELASVLLVASVRWRVGVLAFLFEGEERAPCFPILSPDLLNGRAFDDKRPTAILTQIPLIHPTAAVLT
ncbi:hypothetical protein GCM10009067_34370 [Haloarcula sebkhae]|uniref:Uncharacterized protein n=1 Tax=Haloarcula sebkhae TaxID=932660 RepID=A0A830F3L0_9EURY|nr:hypothetical protein GCM10009067_34370 [Haloarcula sebkhae]